MSRAEARIHTLCWAQQDFIDLLRFSQHAYFLILSQPQVSFCGVCTLDVQRWARLSGDRRPHEMGKAVRRLEQKRFVVTDADTNELLIRTFVKHDGIMSSPNLIVAMSRDFGHIQSRQLRTALLDELGEGFLKGLPEGLLKRLGKPFLEGFQERFPEGLAEGFPPRARGRGAPAPNTPASSEPFPGSGPTGRRFASNGKNKPQPAGPPVPDWHPEPAPPGRTIKKTAVADLRANPTGKAS